MSRDAGVPVRISAELVEVWLDTLGWVPYSGPGYLNGRKRDGE